MQAEGDYETAIYIVPAGMRSKNELFEYYLERKDTVNAMYWANSIVQMPAKNSIANNRKYSTESKQNIAAIEQIDCC